MPAEQSLVEIIHARVSAETLQLPVFHHVALKLMHILAKEDYSIAQVAQIIIEDQALSSHVLRLANSAFFGGLS
jgi:HD-like signal output (HDOD) protein